jgi:hypothetical protein
VAVLIACAALTGAAARAQEVPGAPSAAADDPGQVSELVVVSHPQGPAMWRVQYGDSVMTIMGSVTPIQQQQKWDRRQTMAALDGARLVILPPKVGLDPLQVIALVTTNIWRVRTLGSLESHLPPDLRARFVQARMAARQPEGRYAHWRPAASGFLLLSDMRHTLGYSMGKPGTTVEKMAKVLHIPTRSISNYSVLSLVNLAVRLDDKQNLICLEDALEQAEYERAHVQDMNDDWAHGDVLSVNARYRLPPLQRCLMLAPGARNEIDRAMAEAGDRLWAELQKPGKTVAVIDMAWLLPKDGLLDRLKAHGATVGPPPMIAALEKAEADDGKD